MAEGTSRITIHSEDYGKMVGTLEIFRSRMNLAGTCQVKKFCLEMLRSRWFAIAQTPSARLTWVASTERASCSKLT